MSGPGVGGASFFLFVSSGRGVVGWWTRDRLGARVGNGWERFPSGWVSWLPPRGAGRAREQRAICSNLWMEQAKKGGRCMAHTNALGSGCPGEGDPTTQSLGDWVHLLDDAKHPAQGTRYYLSIVLILTHPVAHNDEHEAPVTRSELCETEIPD